MSDPISIRIAAARLQVKKSRALIEGLRADMIRILKAADVHASQVETENIRALGSHQVSLSVGALLQSIRRLEIMVAALETELLEADSARDRIGVEYRR